MTHLKKRAAVLTAGLLLVTAVATAALADVVQKTGTTNCGTTLIGVKSHSQGATKIYVPQSNHIQTWNNALWTHRTKISGHTNATWKVTATEGLASPGTYGYCTPIN